MLCCSCLLGLGRWQLASFSCEFVGFRLRSQQTVASCAATVVSWANHTHLSPVNERELMKALHHANALSVTLDHIPHAVPVPHDGDMRLTLRRPTLCSSIASSEQQRL
jgi:hypothetical protein